MVAESLLDIKKAPAEVVLKGLRSDNRAEADPDESRRAGLKLVREAARFGIGIRDYLTLAVSTEHKGSQFSELSGYEASLAYLNLPIRDDFKHGIILQAASETFETYPGTRALFPPVLEDILRFTYRQDQIQQLAPMLAGSRQISGNEMISTVANDDGTEYKSTTVAELGRIPIRTIRTSEQSVKMWKHGSGIRTSYEFNRRARLDLLTPFAARVARELELGKIQAAVGVLINGDLAGTAATTVAQTTFSTQAGTTTTAHVLNYQNILAWLVARAEAGVPVDTVIGNYGALYQWMRLFQPSAGAFGPSPAQIMQDTTGTAINVSTPFFPAAVNFVIASAMPADQLMGITKAETIEELREAGGDVAEQEREMLNQSITYLRTEVTGYRLLFKDTRQIYDFST